MDNINTVPDFRNTQDPNNITDLAFQSVEVPRPEETQELERSQETIKVIGSDVDPFIEVTKERNYFSDNTLNPMTYSVRLGRGENKYHIKDVSSKYLLVPNRELFDIMQEIIYKSGLPWVNTRRFMSKVGQFRDIYRCEDSNTHRSVREVGDMIGLVLECQNSYNASLHAGFKVYFERLACKNGMLSKSYSFGYTFKHTLHNVDWKTEILESAEILKSNAIKKLNSFTDACSTLQKPVENAEIKLIRESYLKDLPTQQFGQLMDKYYQDADFSAWGLLNAGTNVLWHAKKQTNANFANNELIVDSMLRYGRDTWGNQTPVNPDQMSIPMDDNPAHS